MGVREKGQEGGALLLGAGVWLKFFVFFFWLRRVFVAVRGLSLVAESEGYSLSWCAGFSLWWLLLLRSTSSRRAGFSNCGMWPQ